MTTDLAHAIGTSRIRLRMKDGSSSEITMPEFLEPGENPWQRMTETPAIPPDFRATYSFHDPAESSGQDAQAWLSSLMGGSHSGSAFCSYVDQGSPGPTTMDMEIKFADPLTAAFGLSRTAHLRQQMEALPETSWRARRRLRRAIRRSVQRPSTATVRYARGHISNILPTDFTGDGLTFKVTMQITEVSP